MSKKVIITGVTGQDGSYMSDYLLAKEFEVYGLVRRLSVPNNENIKHLLGNQNFHIVTGDLSDSHSIDRLVSLIKPDYFINLAAQSFVGSSWQIPEQTFDVDATGVLRCLEALHKHAPNCRFYNAGSSEEMGDVIESPQNMNHPPRARSPYGAAKVAARQLVKVYRESYNMYAVQGLLYNHESPRRGKEFVTRKITYGLSSIAIALNNKRAFKPIFLGNLDAKRDWSHAKDFIDGIWLMMNQEEPKEFILASGQAHSVRDFVDCSCKVLDLKGSWVKGLRPEDEVFKLDSGETIVGVSKEFYRPAEVNLLLGDSSEAKEKLGWKPLYSFYELVEEMVASDVQQINYERR